MTSGLLRLPGKSILIAMSNLGITMLMRKVMWDFVPFADTRKSRHVEVFSNATFFNAEFAMCAFKILHRETNMRNQIGTQVLNSLFMCLFAALWKLWQIMFSMDL